MTTKTTEFNTLNFCKNCVIPGLRYFLVAILLLSVFGFCLEYGQQWLQFLKHHLSFPVSHANTVIVAAYLSLFIALISLCAHIEYRQVPWGIKAIFWCTLVLYFLSLIALWQWFSFTELSAIQGVFYVAIFLPILLVMISIIVFSQ